MDPQKQTLVADIHAFYQKYERFENRNFYIHVALVSLGLACAAITTIAGAWGESKIASVTGVVLSFLIGLQSALPFQRLARLYKIIAAEAKVLHDEVSMFVTTPEDLLVSFKAFAELQRKTAYQVGSALPDAPDDKQIPKSKL